ncbi:response regulator transcription factor [Gracilimonas sp.]|uniref:response regulator transcription factor n=1 Tax=Gracilimonas sp. TaxID=1974203 RepID=UPI003BA8F821
MGRKFPTGPIGQYFDQIANLKRFRDKQRKNFELLTEREIEVLTLLAEGYNNPRMAKELDISRNTVQNHRASIREKLNIKTQVEFVKFALAFDLIQF